MKTILTAVLTATLGGAAGAQSFEWSGEFGETGATDLVTAMAVWDEGSGPELLVGGLFSYFDGALVRHVARWDGAGVSSMAGGFFCGADVGDFEVFDDGGGPALHVGGTITYVGPTQGSIHVVKWTGSGWQVLPGLIAASGAGPVVAGLEVYEGALYAAGHFTKGAAVSHVARRDGTTWVGVGGGLDQPAVGLEVFGERLYAAGAFTQAGGVPASHVAAWDGSTWSAVGGGPPIASGDPGVLAVLDLGAGPELFVGGKFTSPLGDGLLRFDGTAWSGVGGGLGLASDVRALEVFDDGGGPRLFVGGKDLSPTGATAELVSWDGAAWSVELPGVTIQRVTSLRAFDDGGGPSLYVGAKFKSLFGQSDYYLARWDGAVLHPVGASGGQSLSDVARAFAGFDDGNGAAIFAGGDFVTAGGTTVNHVARWSGCDWQPLSAGVNATVYALLSHDDGGGERLYAGGAFTDASGVSAKRIARWDGSAWSPVGSGFDSGSVRALVVHDDGGGPDLYAGGSFLAAGGVPVNRIARWDGSTWSDVGGGGDNLVQALASWEFDGAPALVAGGPVTVLGGTLVNHVGRWDGTAWHAIDGGMDASVRALAVDPVGFQRYLYAGGVFNQAGSNVVDKVARILPVSGATWLRVGDQQPIFGSVDTMAYHDFGGDVDLCVGGDFVTALYKGSKYNNAARGSGDDWEFLGEPNFAPVTAIASVDTGSGPTLLMGGAFTKLVSSGCATVTVTRRVGALALPSDDPISYCTAGTSASGCRASISASGVPSASAPSGFLLRVTKVEGARDGLFYWGRSGRVANPWGNGTSYQCVKLPVWRGALLLGNGTPGTCEGGHAYDLTARWTQKPVSNPGAGSTVQAQFWYRDGQNTSNQGTSFSNAVEFPVCP